MEQRIMGVDLQQVEPLGTTASLIIYSGSANNFPNEMPELGGDIFFRKDSYSTNHASGTRITIEENILPNPIRIQYGIKNGFTS